MLNEYALRFYALLEQSIKIDATEWTQAAMAASAPYMEDSDRKALFEQYQRAGRDIIEEIREAFENDGMDMLKEQFK